MASALSDEVAARVLGEVHELAKMLDRQRAQLEEAAAISQTAAQDMVKNTRKVLVAAEEQAKAFYRNSNDAKVDAQVTALGNCAAAVTDACNSVKKDMRSMAIDADTASRLAIDEGKNLALAAMQQQAIAAIASAASAHRTRASAMIVSIGLVAATVVGATSYVVGRDAGQAQGYTQARDESAVAAWGNSEDGKLAFLIAKADPATLRKIALCNGEGWRKKGSDICIPAPENSGYVIEGWRLSK